jgi:Aspartyl protease
MRRLWLLLILLCLAAWGVWVVPRLVPLTDRAGQRSGGGDGATGASERLPDELGRIFRDLGYASISIDRLRFGHSIVVASVNGRDLRLLLDTGAPDTCLDRRRTEDLKLEWVEEPVPGQARDGMWDHYSSCEVPALILGGATVERLRVSGFNARWVNPGLEAAGYAPVDGVLGADVLDALGAVVDLSGGRLYLRPGKVPGPPRLEDRVWDLPGREVRLPLSVGRERLKTPDMWCLYVSTDRGQTWTRQGEYRPPARSAIYQAAKDGEYWLALQAVWEGGRAEPASPEELVPALKVRVGSARQVVRPNPPPADLLREVTDLRAEIERLRRQVRELETGANKK